MILTLYCAHILILATGVLNNQLYIQYTVILIAMVAFAVIWRRRYLRGPLEALIAGASTWTRRATANVVAAGVSGWANGHRPTEPRTGNPPTTSELTRISGAPSRMGGNTMT